MFLDLPGTCIIYTMYIFPGIKLLEERPKDRGAFLEVCSGAGRWC